MKRIDASFRRGAIISRLCVMFFCASLFLPKLIAQQRTASPWSPPTSEIRDVERLADLYKFSQNEAVTNYKGLFAFDEVQGRRSEWFFEQRNAYEILAVALPHLSGTVRATAIDTLASKKTFSRPVFQALVKELDSINGISVDEDQALGANTTLKTKICGAIARWLEMPLPKVEMLSSDSIITFSDRAKQKAATISESHPSN